MDSNGFLSPELNELFGSYRLERSSDFDIAAYLFAPEHAVEYNAARLLCLIAKAPQGKIAGKRKLVLLDYLLRYPEALLRVLKDKEDAAHLPKDWMQICRFRPFEFGHDGPTLERGMVRFPLGPFDADIDSYLRFLLFRGLITVSVEPSSQLNPLQIFEVTQIGQRITRELHDTHQHIQNRSSLLHRVFDGRSSGIAIYTYLTKNHPSLIYGPLWKEVR